MSGPALQWTSEQAAAIRADHDALLVAGAGTGKTTTVVGKILWLLGLDTREVADTGERLPPPARTIELHQVAAITFTEKAAHDLKRKLRQEIEKTGRPELLFQIDRAFVGTIHSFCGSLLREHALRFGIDPTFRVLDERQARVEQEEVIREVVLESLESAADDDPLAELARVVPLRDRSEFGTGLIDLVRDVLRDTRWHAERYEGWWQGERLDVPMLRELCATWSELDDEPVRACDALVRLALLARERWDAWQERENARDFDALILDARDRLRSEAGTTALEAVRRRYRILIVDEFQDTDAAQRDIAFAIGGIGVAGEIGDGAAAGEPGDGAAKKPAGAPQLFFVGDPKQSIYRFRGADISVWNDVQRTLSRVAPPLPLTENFRSEPAVLEFVNAVGAAAMADAGAALAEIDENAVVSYHPLSPERDASECGAVEWLIADGSTHKERRPIEAEHLAARIRELVGNVDVVDPDSGATRKCAHRDIAVLFRSRLGIDHHEEALRRHAIPYYYQGSGGLAGKLEVLDLVNALRVIDNPADDLRAFGYLRSPFVGLRDEILARIRLVPQIDRELLRPAGDSDQIEAAAQHAPAKDPPAQDTPAPRRYLATFLDAARWFLEQADVGAVEWFDAVLDGRTDTRIADLEKEALRRGLDAIDEAIAIAHRRPLDELLARLLDRAGYRNHLLLFGDAREPLSRIQGFLRLADEHRDLPIGTFLEMWDGWDDIDQGVPQSPLYSAQDDVVTLSTIHSAKGLEWPVVFLIETAKEFREQFTGQFWSDPALGPLRAPRKEERGRRAEIIHERRRLHEQAEEARLLYVATTRARDRLIIVGPQALAGTFSGWLAAGAAPAVRVVHRPPRLPDARSIAVPDPALAWLEAIEGVTPAQAAGDRFELLEPLPAPALRYLSSATERMMKRQRPEEWELRYVHAVEPVWRFARRRTGAAGDGDAGLSPEVRGTLIHGVLERIEEEAELSRVLDEAISDLDVPELEGLLEPGSRYRGALEREILGVIRHDEWRWYVEGEHYREMPFLHLVGQRDWLYGKFDLYRPPQLSAAIARDRAGDARDSAVARDRGGDARDSQAGGVPVRSDDAVAWVVDFKTHDVSTAAAARAVAAKYQVQCDVYQAAASELTGEAVRVRLHFTKPNIVVES